MVLKLHTNTQPYFITSKYNIKPIGKNNAKLQHCAQNKNSMAKKIMLSVLQYLIDDGQNNWMQHCWAECFRMKMSDPPNHVEPLCFHLPTWKTIRVNSHMIHFHHIYRTFSQSFPLNRHKHLSSFKQLCNRITVQILPFQQPCDLEWTSISFIL